MRQKGKKSTVFCKIICARCQKEDFVTFVPDGSRDYYCDNCLKEFNLINKKGKVKKVFDKKRNANIFEFVCDKCEKLKRQKIMPERIDGQLFCRKCNEEIQREEKRAKRKKIILAK